MGESPARDAGAISTCPYSFFTIGWLWAYAEVLPEALVLSVFQATFLKQGQKH